LSIIDNGLQRKKEKIKRKKLSLVSVIVIIYIFSLVYILGAYWLNIYFSVLIIV